MRHAVLAIGLVLAAAPASAQPNPFKLPKSNLKGGAEVSYTLSGDITGTAMMAFEGDRWVRKQTGTMKMMGKTTTSETWTLTTPDSMYNADVSRKQGSVMPNMLPLMAKAYDGLDGSGKKRLHQNMGEMSSLLTKGFGLSSFSSMGEDLGSKTYAGQSCEERKFGPVVMCSMDKAPVVLHSQTRLLCFNMEETATEVKLGAVSPAAFAPPAGVVFAPDKHVTNADSAAQGLVSYLASQQLADSLAKAKAELQAAQAKAGAQNPGEMPKMTPEQEASMQKACETMKNLDVGKVIADAANDAMKQMAAQAKQAALDAGKNAVNQKIQGVFKKPKIPLM
jgi:hypothetical protein